MKSHLAPNAVTNRDRKVAFQVRLPVSLVLALDARAYEAGESVAVFLERIVRVSLSRKVAGTGKSGGGPDERL